jgi:hypothetical protein
MGVDYTLLFKRGVEESVKLLDEKFGFFFSGVDRAGILIDPKTHYEVADL